MIDPEIQASHIFQAFHLFLKGGPNRKVVLSRDSDGFKVSLDEEWACRSGTLQDAASQAATVVTFDAATEQAR